MKVLLALLACSLAANAAYFVVRARGPASSPRELRASSAASTPEALAALAVEKADTDRATGERYFALAHTDPKTLKEQLEAAGYPPHLVKAVVGALIGENSIARQHEILRNQKETPFWQTGDHMLGYNTNDPEAMRAVSALQRETNERYRSIFGDTISDDVNAMAAYRRLYGDLPAEKIARLQRIESDYLELQRQIAPWPTMGRPSPADQEKFALLEKEKRADMAAILTPEELFELDLRTSRTATQLRFSLNAFSPTEEEFRKIFSIQKAIDEAKGRPTNTYGPYSLSVARDDELLTRLDGVISPERIEDLKFATEPTNATLTRLTNRLGLPISTAKEVIQLRDATMLAASKLKAEASLTPDERTAQLKALAQTANERTTSLLTARGVEAYLQYGGSWLNSITSTPTNRPSPAR